MLNCVSYYKLAEGKFKKCSRKLDNAKKGRYSTLSIITPLTLLFSSQLAPRPKKYTYQKHESLRYSFKHSYLIILIGITCLALTGWRN